MSLNFKYNPGKRKTCELIHWAIAVLVILCILSGISAIVFGVLVGKPGFLAMKMKDATCRVVEWRFITRLSCDCSGLKSDDPYCTSKFPCIQIIVAYEPWRTEIPANNTNSFKTSTMIHESEIDLNGRFEQCSFHSCETEYKTNQLLMENFKNKYGQIGEFYLCKYNPDNPTQVVTRINFSKVHLLVSLIAPPSAFLVCLLALAGIFLTRCFIKKRNALIKARQNQDSSYVAYNSPAFVPDEDIGSNLSLSNGNPVAIEINVASQSIQNEPVGHKIMSQTVPTEAEKLQRNLTEAVETGNTASNGDAVISASGGQLPAKSAYVNNVNESENATNDDIELKNSFNKADKSCESVESDTPSNNNVES